MDTIHRACVVETPGTQDDSWHARPTSLQPRQQIPGLPCRLEQGLGFKVRLVTSLCTKRRVESFSPEFEASWLC